MAELSNVMLSRVEKDVLERLDNWRTLGDLQEELDGHRLQAVRGSLQFLRQRLLVEERKPGDSSFAVSEYRRTSLGVRVMLEQQRKEARDIEAFAERMRSLAS
jgi:hypothetical protein